MATQGTAVLDFGTGAMDANVSVTGQGAITTSNLVESWVALTATSNNTADNAWVEPLQVRAGNIQNGIGFTIYGRSLFGRAFGQYNINWVWN
jgi:hypothetical protein